MLVSKAGGETGEDCDQCGAPMKVVNPYGGSSYFAGCSMYPGCNNSKQLSVEMLGKIPRVIDRWDKGTMDEAISRLVPLEISWRPNSYDEVATRREFIDPILRSLGWDTNAGKQVEREFKTNAGKADYCFYTSEGEVFAVGEAKKLFENLSRHTEQITDYMKAIPVNLGILTNGLDWEIYNRDDKGEIQLAAVVMDIISETDEEHLSEMVELIRFR